MIRLLEPYRLSFPATLVYMLQKSEYDGIEYLRWLWRTSRFSQVAKRSSLEYTVAARALLAASWWTLLAIIMVGVSLIYYGLGQSIDHLQVIWGAMLILGWPVTLAHLIILPNWLGRIMIIKPARMRMNLKTAKLFREHPGLKITVAGSYGKTSMKEMLATVLSEGKSVAATLGNLNTEVGHYRFAQSLKGDEEVLIVEYGEYRPGDIARFNAVVNPKIGFLTGLNEAHLVNFRTIDRSAANLMALSRFVRPRHCYINGESEKLLYYSHPRSIRYDRQGVNGWVVSAAKTDLGGVNFTLKKARRKLSLTSQLVGLHHIGPLAAVVDLADSLGLTSQQIIAGIAKTKPFEHRLQPVLRADGIMVIDDTYNGTPDGMRAGLELLKSLTARKKIYVTPGLVEMGKATKNVHIELGELIATATDTVVLMENSVTKFIQQGLHRASFKGEVIIVNDPPSFYQHIGRVAASGDLVMLQNDWADNYA